MKKKSSAKNSNSMRPHSSILVDGPERAAARAMLYPVGFKRGGFQEAASSASPPPGAWSRRATCTLTSSRSKPRRARTPPAARRSSSTPSPSPTASRWAREGMKYSLVSREVIADSIETVVGCEGMDGFVAIGGCDKNMPGCAHGHGAAESPGRVRLWRHDSARLPHRWTNEAQARHRLRVRSHRPARRPARSTTQELHAVEACAIPGPGSCGGMYTANTMASAIEALGMSLPNSSAQNAISPAKMDDCRRAGAAVVEHVQARHHARSTS